MPPSDGFIDSGSYPQPHQNPPPFLTTASWCGRISLAGRERPACAGRDRDSKGRACKPGRVEEPSVSEAR